MKKVYTTRNQRQRRKERTRAHIRGKSERPRLAVFRSLQHISAQIIDDAHGVTLVAASDHDAQAKGTKTEQAAAVGKLLAERAKAKGVTQVVFDRSWYQYHGRVQALAEAARQGGLVF